MSHDVFVICFLFHLLSIAGKIAKSTQFHSFGFFSFDRLEIKDITNKSDEIPSMDKLSATTKQTSDYDDFPQLIIPKKIVQSKLKQICSRKKI